MRAALIVDGMIVNVIVADAENDTPPGGGDVQLVSIPDNLPVDTNWLYSDDDGFTDPRPPPEPPEVP